MSNTTIWIDHPTKDRLQKYKQATGAKSMAQAIRRLMDNPESPQAIYRRRKKEVDAVCRRYGVKRLIAFGSLARGDGDALSDLDLAVDVPEAMGLAIIDLFDDLAQAVAFGCDVIEYPEDGSRMRANVDRDGVVLYAQR